MELEIIACHPLSCFVDLMSCNRSGIDGCGKYKYFLSNVRYLIVNNMSEAEHNSS